jgi:hypothetical protein
MLQFLIKLKFILMTPKTSNTSKTSSNSKVQMMKLHGLIFSLLVIVFMQAGTTLNGLRPQRNHNSGFSSLQLLRIMDVLSMKLSSGVLKQLLTQPPEKTAQQHWLLTESRLLCLALFNIKAHLPQLSLL